MTRGELLVYRQLYLDQQGPAEWVRWERYAGRAVEMEVYLMPGATPHMGFFFGERGKWMYPTRQFLVPMWAVEIVFGVAPGTCVVLALRRKRGPGVCRKCGYDLTGNVSGVCPECGGTITR